MTVYRRTFLGLRGIRTVLKQFDESKLTEWQRDLLKERLKLLAWYDANGKNKKATANHFATSRSHISKLVNLRDEGGMYALVPDKPGPKHKRGVNLNNKQKIEIEKVAWKYKDWGHKKLKKYIDGIEASTIYRYLKEKDMLVRNRCPGFHKKIPKGTTKWKVKRIRLPDDYEHNLPGDLVALDSIVEYVGPNRNKLYFICALDLATRVGIAVATKKHSSREARKVLQLISEVLQVRVDAVLTDNGSEFLGDFQVACEKETIEHFFTRPRTPKDNACAERFNQTLQRGFYWRCALTKPLDEINDKLASWLIEYNCLRPHESLDMMTPTEKYFKTFYRSRIRLHGYEQVYSRLWNRTVN